jgi:hypothetical protein
MDGTNERELNNVSQTNINSNHKAGLASKHEAIHLLAKVKLSRLDHTQVPKSHICGKGWPPLRQRNVSQVNIKQKNTKESWLGTKRKWTYP